MTFYRGDRGRVGHGRSLTRQFAKYGKWAKLLIPLGIQRLKGFQGTSPLTPFASGPRWGLWSSVLRPPL